MATIMATDPQMVIKKFHDAVENTRALSSNLTKCATELEEKGNEISAGLATFVPAFKQFIPQLNTVADALEEQEKSLRRTFGTVDDINGVSKCEL